MWQYNNSDELYHHGILGMKWGIRRYQNKDGSLTPAGKKRVRKLENEYSKLTNKNISKNSKSNTTSYTKKSAKTMTNEELRKITTRMQLENNYARELATHNSMYGVKGKKVVDDMKNRVIKDAVVNVGRQVVEQTLRSAIKNTIKKNK